MAYLKMANWKYYTLTLSLYIICILGAIFVEDIAIIFDFVGAFGLSITCYLLPGLIYLVLLRNEKAFHEVESPKQRKCNTIGAYSVIAMSVFNMILVIVKQFTGVN